MDERAQLRGLLEIYDDAIEELYVLGDRRLVDLILRLERCRQKAAGRLAELGGDNLSRVSTWVAAEIESVRAPRSFGERDLLGAKDPATSPNDAVLRVSG